MAMDMKQLEEKVKDIIVEELGVEREKPTSGASFMEDLGADSHGPVGAGMALGKDFHIQHPDEEGEKHPGGGICSHDKQTPRGKKEFRIAEGAGGGGTSHKHEGGCHGCRSSAAGGNKRRWPAAASATDNMRRQRGTGGTQTTGTRGPSTPTCGSE